MTEITASGPAIIKNAATEGSSIGTFVGSGEIGDVSSGSGSVPGLVPGSSNSCPSSSLSSSSSSITQVNEHKLYFSYSLVMDPSRNF